MNEDSLKHGAFGWNELMTTDVPAARQFYQELFGWKLEDYSMSEMNYTVVKVAGSEVGGIMQIPPDCQGMPPCWGVYVTVTDVDDTARQVEKLGGQILRPPADIPDVGRFCVLQDPQGAVLCAISYTRS